MIEYGNIGGMETYLSETVVIGSGASGYNAACLLRKGFVDDLVLITPEKKSGTSRNAGCEKMSYWRLALGGEKRDSVRDMAASLTVNGSVDGDIALAEASLSTSSFMRLSDLGVPFPTSRYGEFIGYPVEGDDRPRSTTIGPLTSKYMTDYLEYEATREGVDILEGFVLVKIVVKHGVLKGIVVMNRETSETRFILTRNLVLATGAPGNIYENSLYPVSQTGSLGVAMEAGVKGRNLSFWQYGIGSVKARMKVSGVLLSSIPEIYSVDRDGNRHDFLKEAGLTVEDVDKLLLEKASEYGFDARKLEGTSKLDILVEKENKDGRKVYLDYREESELTEDTEAYFKEMRASFSRPVDRLRAINSSIYEMVRDRGVDLDRQPLEVNVSSYHMNGGLAVDRWWQTDVEGIFAIGEIAGTHGPYIPEGASLNAGQVGARRASSWILEHGIGEWYVDAMNMEDDVKSVLDSISTAMEGDVDAETVGMELKALMSEAASVSRRRDAVEKALLRVDEILDSFSCIKVDRVSRISELFSLKDTILTDKAVLSSILDYIDNASVSIGSAIYPESTGNDGDARSAMIQEVVNHDGRLSFSWREPEPIPAENGSFEKDWAGYRRNKNVF